MSRELDRASVADTIIYLYAYTSQLAEFEGDETVIRLRAKDDAGDYSDGISGHTGNGIEDLVQHLTQRFGDMTRDIGIATRERHRIAMQDALVHLLNAESIVQQGPEMYDIGAEELRISCRVLDTLIGRVDVESSWMRFFQAFVLKVGVFHVKHFDVIVVGRSRWLRSSGSGSTLWCEYSAGIA